MAVLTKHEETRDMQKVTMRTLTYQATEEFEPSAGVRAYRKEQNDAVWTVTEEYLLPQESDVYMLSMDATTSQDPLETCPKFAGISATVWNLWTTWKRNPNDPALGEATNKDPKSNLWTPQAEANEDEGFAKFWDLYKSGTTSYLAPRVQLRMTRVEEGPPSYANVGYIETPPEPFADENIWLLNSVRGQQEGDLWRNTYEWMHAAAGKTWDINIYTPPSNP